MHLCWRLLNDKSSRIHFSIKVWSITVIFQSQVMTSFSILWLPMSGFEGVLLPLRILKCSSYHIQIVITQEYLFCNLKYRFDIWRWRKLTFWRNTVMHLRIILMIMPNALSRVCTSELTWHLLIFIESKREVPRGVRNSKVRRQDKFRRDWSRHKNTSKSQSGTGPGVRRSKRPLLACRTRCIWKFLSNGRCLKSSYCN